ncbi:hypothetical protein GP475_02795 [Corynebacterium poyangense]|uniref:Uncharacterized protein n=1 Tax=Corynebacterium poyangense TaxID=2684405 RepID=A0A7H0SMB5_9CORY|nr:hypothetical protein [Corynebacterium poyangense]QNQ89690.1 hypothetical protein GP475_02795 [Corynebacterium poyangense]
MSPMLPASPIPTPASVRIFASLLTGLAVAILSTSLSRGVQVSIMVLCHPYRRKIRTYLESHNVVYRPTLTSLFPLFLVWLALMLVPVLAPLPSYGTFLIWIGISAWMYLSIPHIDGSRALAHISH